jgi:hypothetical protein
MYKEMPRQSKTQTLDNQNTAENQPKVDCDWCGLRFDLSHMSLTNKTVCAFCSKKADKRKALRELREARRSNEMDRDEY